MRTPSMMEKTSSTQQQKSRVRVLVVDDIAENLELLEDVLAEYGYETLSVRNGLEALDLLQRESVQLIVADAMMPKMDGFQLCKEVKGNPSFAGIPFVIYTANYVDKEDEELAQTIGVDRYVVKYAGLGALVDAINDLTRDHYGFKSRVAIETPERMDDAKFLEKHHAILVRKLEEKMAELEMYAETLTRKNRELQYSEQRYRTLFENASVAIFVLEKATGRIVDVNKQAISLLGYTRHELLAMTESPFVADQSIPADLYSKEGMPIGERSVQRKDGETIHVGIDADPVDGKGEERVMLFVRDISEERRMREELIHAEKLALMGCLTAGIAHDIRNPLAAATLNVQYLLQKYGAQFADVDALRALVEATGRIEQIIENTLSMARMKPLMGKPEDLNDLVSRALRFLTIGFQEKKLRLNLQVEESPPSVLVDPGQVQQVIINLVQNAIEASPEGAEVFVTVERGTESTEMARSYIKVSIRDQGKGITGEHGRDLFKPLRTTKSSGTGLGLALAKHIMDRHAGEIRITTPPEGGTLIELLFFQDHMSGGL